jgi:lysophospholipase L1-like esterase
LRGDNIIMKIIKYIIGFLCIIGLVIAAWIYYPQYQILQMQKQVAKAGAGPLNISYANYFRNFKKNQLNILAIGDSIIHGKGAPKSANLVYQFSNNLRNQIHKKTQVNIHGINGITSGELEKLVLNGKYDNQIKKADIVIINVGGDDILQMAMSGNVYKAIQNFDELKSNFSRNLNTIVARIKSVNRNATLVFLELYNPLPPTEQIYSVADKLLPNWNLQIYEVANRFYPSIVIQTTKVINGEKRNNLSTDGIHPNSAGYAAISAQMIDQFDHQYRKKTG